MMFSKSAQFSVIEIAFLFFIFIFAVGFFVVKVNVENPDYKFATQSILDSLYFDENFKKIIFFEDLVSVDLTENWNFVFAVLDEVFGDYHLRVSDGSLIKDIKECEGLVKVFSEKVISYVNDSDFGTRYVQLGVCF